MVTSSPVGVSQTPSAFFLYRTVSANSRGLSRVSKFWYNCSTDSNELGPAQASTKTLRGTKREHFIFLVIVFSFDLTSGPVLGYPQSKLAIRQRQQYR